MSEKEFYIVPPKDGIEWVKGIDDDPQSMIGCGIIFDHKTQTVLFCNGDGSDALIPADLLPEDLTTARGDLDALRVVKHLVELIRKHEQEQKDLWQYIKRGKMLARAEELAEQCRATDQQCPYVDTDCPLISVRGCGQVTPEHWLEILRKEAEQE